MSITEHNIRFGAGPLPLDKSIRKDVPFWERDAVVELIQIPDRKDGWKIKSITAPYYEL